MSSVLSTATVCGRRKYGRKCVLEALDQLGFVRDLAALVGDLLLHPAKE